MLALSLIAALVWGHQNLRAILEQKNDALLEGKRRELASLALEASDRSSEAQLIAEMRREVAAYRGEGLVVVYRGAEETVLAPDSPASREISSLLLDLRGGAAPRTIEIGRPPKPYRVLQSSLAPRERKPVSLDLALDLSPTTRLLSDFDRRLSVGGLGFLAIAVWGGFFLSRRALRPVAESVETARLLNPADLSARLPRSGAHDELDELARTINDLLDRLAAYHEQITQFTADASHELRSPLGAMRTAVEVALQQPRRADEYRQTLESLGLQCERLSDLVNNLLLLAKADAGQIELRRDAVDLAEVVNETVELYQPVADERQLTIEWRSPGPMFVSGDGRRLRQLATNLLDNAIKFTEAGGRVCIYLEAAQAQARLVVADSGIGIAADRLPRIFDRFYQVDSARSGRESGLGLSICRWIVEAHGGTIQATSAAGRGTTLTVLLPKEPRRRDAPGLSDRQRGPMV